MSSGLSLSEFLLWTSFAKYSLARCNILTAWLSSISLEPLKVGSKPLSLSLSLSSLWLLRSGSKHYIIYASCLLGIISGLKKYSVWLWAPNFKQLLSQQIENILLKKFLNLLMQLYTNTSDTLNMELLPFTGKLNWFRLYWKMFRLVTTNNTKTGCWSGH